MNFLSHYYFDRHATDPNLVLGTILPDLVKNADKTWHLHPARYAKQLVNNAASTSLLYGWNRHLEIDKHFHSSAFFSNHTAEIRTKISPVLDNSPVRPSFLAHISLELMLDSLLITGKLVDPDAFYVHLRQVDHNGLDRFLAINGITERGIFFRFLQEFIQAKYLHSYQDPSNIIYALNRICQRLWIDPLSETQKLQLTAVLTDYLDKLGENFMEIFFRIETLMKGDK
ncbi:hypothetical protein [Hufsiella ginkgonis]|uniref:DUF479 domain-containing protein n=1 Tax=Hufsiella ginkgonis TaxID=2695274 RepID=A0A7K1XS71_9SPHI|nr:hypothetical protein [Hufsiella ginkgonis]MXV13835.1 hypothetical protein [Hufsiella ginkgonis]